MLKTHGPNDDGQPGARFWIREKKNSVKPDPGTPSQYREDKVSFPGEYQVFDAMPFGSIRTRFNPKEKKENTNAITSLKFPQFRIIKVQSKKNSSHSIKVGKVGQKKITGYVLAQIDYKEESTEEP